MREFVVPFDPSWGELVDVDLVDASAWVALFRKDDHLTVRTPRDECAVPGDLHTPLIRALDDERVVVVDTWMQGDRPNALVVSTTDGATTGFRVGSGIQDVLASRDTLVITCFDEGIFRNIPPGHEGVTVFDDTGHYRGGYHSKLGPSAVQISDCCAACWIDDTRIAFLPYTEFPLVTLDVTSFDQNVVSTPPTVHFAHAISSARDGSFSFALLGAGGRIVRWSGGPVIDTLGAHEGPMRGLRGGRFIAHGVHEFTIVEPVPASDRQ